MPVTVTRDWIISLGESSAVEALSDAIRRQQGEITSLSPLTAKTGHFWKTRFFGGMLVSTRDLPMQVRVLTEKLPEGLKITATVADRVGFGIKTGMVGKLKTRCVTLLDALQQATAASTSPDDLRKLKALHEDGIITREEYEAKRRSLVERL